MSTERGNVKKKGAPAHQNKTAFHHNKNSRLTKKIAALPNEGLCEKCHTIIEWKKKYRKYKPLKVPGKCLVCTQRSVRHAYHVICQECAAKDKVCAKCREKKDIVHQVVTEEDRKRKENNFTDILKGLSERQRRSVLRRIDRGEISEEEVARLGIGKLGLEEEEEEEDDEDDDDDDEDDEDDDDDDDIDDKEEEEPKAKQKPAAAKDSLLKATTKPKTPTAVEDEEEAKDENEDEEEDEEEEEEDDDDDDDENDDDSDVAPIIPTAPRKDKPKPPRKK